MAPPSSAKKPKPRFSKKTPKKLQGLAARKLKAKEESNEAKKKQAQKFFYQPLVDKKPLEKHLVVYVGPAAANCNKSLKELTGESPIKPVNLTYTPKRTHLISDENTGVGNTPNGSKLVITPSRVVEFKSSTPRQTHFTKLTMYLLIRAQDYAGKKNPSRVMRALCTNTILALPNRTIKATPATRKSQVSRSKLKTQNAVWGHSAREDAVSFFKNMMCGDISEVEIEKEVWNWCHEISCAIGQKAIDGIDGTEFNPQTKDNLPNGTRVLNENMMQTFENIVLKLLCDVEIKEIEYIAKRFRFKDSNILAKLTLKACIKTHDNGMIEMERVFEVDDNRRVSREFATALYGAITGLIAKPTPIPKPDCAKQLTF